MRKIASDWQAGAEERGSTPVEEQASVCPFLLLPILP